MSKHYHLRFDAKLVHGICVIRRIPCACVACKTILDKPCIYGILSTKQACYQPVANSNYWIALGSYNNLNIIHLTPKLIPSEAFDEIYKVFIDRIIENMASLVQSGMYGDINTDNTTTSLFYFILFISEAYTLQNNTAIDRQVISSGELVVKEQYICSMQEKTNWYWKHNHCNIIS